VLIFVVSEKVRRKSCLDDEDCALCVMSRNDTQLDFNIAVSIVDSFRRCLE